MSQLKMAGKVMCVIVISVARFGTPGNRTF